MSDEWLTVQQTADRLGCPPELVHAMLHGGFLPGEKVDDPWLVKADRVKELQGEIAIAPEPPMPVSLRRVDAGMLEVSIALAGVATAIAAFLPGISGVSEFLALTVATISSTVALVSAYGSLWLLARFCLPRDCLTEEPLIGLKEVWALLRKLDKIGPYKFIAAGLLFLLALSIFVGVLAVARSR
jgi:hypothetical protein